MQRKLYYGVSGLLLAVIVPVVTLITHAQQLDCSDSVKTALQMTSTNCDQINRNKACYGNSFVIATPNDGISSDNFVFQKPGDVVDISKLHNLRLAPFDAKSKQWGIAYMRIQANLPDTTAGQYVTMLMFGDTAIQNQSQLVSTASNTVNPMQAIYFRSGVGSPTCHNAPTSGLILQVPGGAQPVRMTVDGVEMGISSTVFIEAPADDLDEQLPFRAASTVATTVSATLTPTIAPLANDTSRHLKISTIEGHVTVTSNGQTVTVTSGKETTVDLDEQSRGPANGATPKPVQDDSGLPNVVNLLVQPGIGNSLLTPTTTFTPQPGVASNASTCINTTDTTITVTVTQKTVNTRRSPSVISGLIKIAMQNQTFQVLGRAGSGTTAWYLVALPDGTQGWISSTSVALCPANAFVKVVATLPPPTATVTPSVTPYVPPANNGGSVPTTDPTQPNTAGQ